jgi:hypothetical protein
MKLARFTAWLTAVLVVVGGGFAVLNLLRRGSADDVTTFLFVVPAVAFAFVGYLIARRLPGNAVASLCLAIGLLWGAVLTSSAVSAWAVQTGATSRALANWINWAGVGWVPALGLMGTHLPLRLPDGRLRSQRWRRYARACTAIIVLVTLLIMAEPGQGDEFTNPMGVAWVVALAPAIALLPLSFVGGVAALVVRYRDAEPVERRQIRCIAFGAAVFVGVYATSFALVGNWEATLGPAAQVLIVIAQLAYAAIPAAIGVAVLRYRLYDIDRIISRTLSYAVLTALLGAVYAGGVLLLGTLVRASSDLAVAGATLVVAALFTPARRRVQQAVDRRFNRERYDAEQTVQAFATRLRDEVDLDELRRALLAAVHETVEPARASLWLSQARR